MEMLENGPNVAKNTENVEFPEKPLKGFEGRVFTDIIFKSGTNKKGKTTYKSSDPERKIILLSDFSEIPKDNNPCRILIVKDTEPDNPMGGKMIAKIIKEDIGEAEAKVLALNLEKDREAKKYENILTPEYRKKLADLVKECIKYNIGDDPTYPKQDGDNHNQREKAIERGKTVIELRRQLRDEGSKAVSYILELSRSTKDAARLHDYSRIVYFAASDKDSKKVMQFYSLDSVIKIGEIMPVVRDVMKRIGSATDIDALNNYLDKVLQTDCADKSWVGREVLRIMVEIKGRTTDPADVERINKAIEHIKIRIEKIGAEFQKIAPPVILSESQKKIKEDFENKFLDAELASAINAFRYFWESYFFRDDRYNEGVEAVATKLKTALIKYHTEDKMPELLNNAYWVLLLRECRNPKNPEFSKIMDNLRNLTGIAPDYQAMDEDIQSEYSFNLFQGGGYFRSPDLIRELYKRTGVKCKADPETVQNKCLELFTADHFAPTDSKVFLDVIKEVTGISPDFSSIESNIQDMYKTIILYTRSYEERYLNGLPGLKNAEVIYKATGIRPKIDEVTMQRIYKKWILENESVQLITTGEVITGIQPDFTGAENAVQSKYYTLVASIDENILTSSTCKSRIADIERITKIAPIFDEARVQKAYLEHALKYHSRSSLTMIQELTGIVPNFEPHKDRIKSAYFTNLTGYGPYELEKCLHRIEILRQTSGIDLDFNQDEMRRIFDYAIPKLSQIGKLSQLFKLEEILPNPELLARVAGEILLNSLDNSDSPSFRLAIEKMKKLKTPFNPEGAIALVRGYLSYDPKKVIGVRNFLKGESQDDEFVFSLQKAISHDPWVAALSKLEKIQGIAANAANDPWEKELRPLLQRALNSGFVSVEREEDAELVISFLEMMGMNNLPILLKVYIDCRRHKDPDGLSWNTLLLCEQVGIKTRNINGSWRFKSSLELFNEIRKALKNMRTDLLADIIPNNIETDLGIELFSRLKGRTQFVKNSHSVSAIVKKWKEATQKLPSLAELPPGFKETAIKVSFLKWQKTETTQDQAEQLDKLITGQETIDVYLPLAETWNRASNRDTHVWFLGVEKRLRDERSVILELVSKSQEEIERMIADENDPKLKQVLIKKSKALQNPKGRQGIERQAELLEETADKIVEISEKFVKSPEDEGDYVTALEALNSLDGKIPLGKEIRELSAFHMCDTVMGDEWKELIFELFGLPTHEGVRPTVERIYGVQKIAKEYVEEHYLHHLQELTHSEHTPFTPELLEKLSLVWDQRLDKQTGYMPITFLKNKLDKILGAVSGTSHREQAVSLIPVSGLLNIYSGDLGDSCHTSQHEAIASGKFPGLRTWVYATNRGKQNEELRGSALIVQAEKIDGVPVLVVRANNPSENFIQATDSDAFVVGVLKEAVETAKRLRADRIKNYFNSSLVAAKLRQMVAIPMDIRGAASTNRQSVNDVYRRRFILCDKIRLKNTAETNFNDYPVWNDTDTTPSVVIWEIDEDGNEQWHGDWK